jgi:hypothetical protein
VKKGKAEGEGGAGERGSGEKELDIYSFTKYHYTEQMFQYGFKK